MKKLFLLLAAIITFALNVAAQTQNVKGVVVSADNGEPLIGATVMGVGTSVGVVTDIDGNFDITLPTKVKKLSVSYVGMKTAEPTITPGKMTIALEGSNVLDEVITVAYGTAKRSQFTGSASVVDASQIEAVQVSNPVNALSGKVSGVQLTNASGAPGSSPTVLIRGISSINAGTAPLYIVDGAPYEGDLNNLSTTDIESMTVLKDAASNALYGARGANGVIMITTKKGKGSNARVTFDARIGQNSRATKDYDVITDPATYYQVYAQALGRNYLYTQGFYNLDPNAEGYQAKADKLWGSAMNYINTKLTAPTEEGGIGILGYNVFTTPEGQQFIVPGSDYNMANVGVNPNSTLGAVVNGAGGQQYLIRPDRWMDYALRNSLRQEYNMSVSKADEKGSFYASMSYLDNEGLAINSNLKRLTGRLSADIMAKPWLKVGANANYTHFSGKSLSNDGDGASSGNIFAVANQLAPIYPLFIRDAQGAILKDKYGNTLYDYGDGKLGMPLVRPTYSQANPISQALLDVDSYQGNSMTGTVFAEVRFLNDFKFTTNNTVFLDETRFNNVTNPFFGPYATQNGAVTVSHSRTQSFTYQQLLNWAHQFGAHNISALIGHEAYQLRSYSLSANSHNMLLPSNQELDGCIINDQNGSSIGKYNNEGYLSRVNYDYDGKYFASASFRRDASSRFHPKHRWGNFWSLGGAWILSNEEFINIPWVDILKLKASYGEQGNDQIGNFRYQNMYSIVNSGGVAAAQPETYGNERITWETGGNFNAGVDFELLNNRIGGTVEYFYRKTSDMLFSFPLPPSFGYTSYYDNIGDMRNYGVELDLHGDIIRTRDLTWSANLNLTWYRNEVLRLPAERRTMNISGVPGFSSGSYYYAEGHSLFTYMLKEWAGVNPETGVARWWKDEKNAEGEVTRVMTENYNEATRYLCGKALPDAYGGFGTSVNYKGFDLSVQFNYQLGGQVYDGTYASLISSPNDDSRGHAIHKDVFNAWTPENKNSAMPRFFYQSNDQYFSSSSSRFLTSASYLSLQQINLGYSLPARLTKKAQIERIRLYVAGDNLALWSARQGLDPRQSITGSVSNAYYSPVRTVSGGVTIQF